jgi:hypothetical protein
MKPVDLTAVRHWVGLFSTSPDASGTPNIELAAFRYDTGIDGTAFWRCVTIAGTGTSNETTVTTVAVAVVKHTFCTMLLAATVEFYVDDVLVATHTTYLPALATYLAFAVRVVNLASATRATRWGRMAIRNN